MPAVDGMVINLTASDPRNGNQMMRWDAQAELLHPDIMVIHNALPFLSELPADAERAAEGKDAWEPSTVIAGDSAEASYDTAHRGSSHISLSGPEVEKTSTLLRLYGTMLHACESALLQFYTADVNPFATVSKGSGWELLRYAEGTRFGRHTDVVALNPVLSQRRLSVVAFCNEDYAGGHLVFPRQGVDITPEAGAMVVFPSGVAFPHEAEMVTRGVRYSVVTWYF